MLTPDEQEYYNALEETFGTPGWKILVEEAKAQIYQMQADGLEVKTWEQVCELRGRAAALANIVNLETITSYSKAQAEDRED